MKSQGLFYFKNRWEKPKFLNIRAELKKNGYTTILNFPCNDYDIDIALQNLCETDMTAVKQYCSHLGSEFRELSCLENRTIDIDELNFLAKYLDSMTRLERNQFRAAMVVEKPTEIRDMTAVTTSAFPPHGPLRILF